VPVGGRPERNPHRSGQAWTLHTVRAILVNPRYTGRQVWNRQRTDADLVDPANTGLGHRAVARWNLPEGWVISTRPAHPAISEADYIAAQDLSLRRGPDSPAARCYRLAGPASTMPQPSPSTGSLPANQKGTELAGRAPALPGGRPG
jgi:hypothetical protein